MKNQLTLEDEWQISSIYSFLSKENEIPIVDREDKIKLVKKYINEKIETDALFPLDNDFDDICWILNEWAKDNLSENQCFFFEYVDDGNRGYIRVMLFKIEQV